ncbi:hypothetical protein OU792_18190, partial [Algoriphagus sp. NF]|uniref:imm11 family protein n=1 Tax=Algoriphagus sp. NF TaxID=2992756 RepID=UPI00237B1FDB
KVHGVKETKEYFIPSFSQRLDVLDREKTLFVQGTTHIIKPVFSFEKVKKYSLFFLPQQYWEITSGLYVSDALKNAMQKMKLTGVDFENTTVL